jgi:glycosyltransferase involved in cell wall biosynthesis
LTALPTADSADVALLLEGTYPFVQGGVSSWVHNIILGFPDIRFAAVFLGSKPEDYQGIRYELPKNLVHLEVHYLQASRDKKPTMPVKGDPQVFQDVKAMHEAFLHPSGSGGHDHGNNHGHGHGGGDAFAAAVGHLIHGRLREEHFLDSKESWEMITSYYRERSTDPGFLDYFWTVRSMHEPIWALARIARSLIPARCYHSVSTGYAGFLGSLLAQVRGKPFILSEHGLYTKERKIDLFHSTWIPGAGSSREGGPPEGNYIRKLWIRFFEALGRTAYDSADPIVSLYEGIRSQQVSAGAREERTRCIPNGIKLARFVPLRDKQTIPPRPVFALIGRIVPIKDVKTYIRAMRAVCNRIPGAEGWLVGPGEEDSRYFDECKALAEALGLGEAIRFLGFQDVAAILPQVAVLILSSISEALPLTLLEGFAAGVPAVATDVGSCRQLIEGRAGDAADVGLGAAGRVVDIADSAALSEAMIGLYSDQEEWLSARKAALARVERYYSEQRMLESYAEIYRKALD